MSDNLYRVIKPYDSNLLHSSKSLMGGASKCYKEVKKVSPSASNFSIMHMKSNEIYDFNINNLNQMGGGPDNSMGGTNASLSDLELLRNQMSSIEKRIIAIENKLPYVIVTSSGGARMQEGIVSLMQMPRTIAAVDLLNENNIPYIVVLTEPTTGGVTASFAMLGDITIAEKGATIGFAGKRVIQDTIREELPIDFQKAEYLKDHGMVDIVSHRKDLKETLYKVLDHIS